jgi:hypothetical protein
MKLGLIIGLAMVLAAPTPVFAAAPMVEKQIFGAPTIVGEPAEPPRSGSADKKEMADQKIKNEILFTGVIITPKRKIALIKEKKETEKALVRKEGDTIHGMMLKTIASNHVIITDPDGKDIRYNLFQSDRKRPDAPAMPPPEAKPAPGQEAGPPGATPTGRPQAGAAASKTMPTNGQPLPGPVTTSGGPPGQGTNLPNTPGQTSQTPKPNPFGEIFKKFKEDRVKGVVPNSNFRNPFQDAMNKAMGQ